MREIKFRGLRVNGNDWAFGQIYKHEPPLVCFGGRENPKYFILSTGSADWNMPRPINQHEVFEDSVGQYTGIQDKNGVDIYEGDLLEYYELKRYSQQSHFDINPEIYTYTLEKRVSQVTFLDGIFSIDNTDNPVLYIGLHNLKEVKDYCNCFDDEDTDMNGNKIDERILGIKVIGNIYENETI